LGVSRKLRPSELVFIYALRDPRDKRVIYVGQTLNPKARYHQHCSDKRHVFRSLLPAPLKPELIVIDQCDAPEAAKLENFHIVKALREGQPLLDPGEDFRERERFSRRKRRLISRLRKWKPIERNELLRALFLLWPPQS
jgi:predicted GIY-YIG superfamily endonuclease